MRFTSTISAVLALTLATPALPQSRLPKTEGTVSLDFHDVDIQDVVRSIAEITGKNFVIDDRVRGKISVISPSPVSVEEAYKVFQIALQIKGLCAIDDGPVTKVIPSRECGSDNTRVTQSDSIESGAEIITKIVPLKYIDANEIKTALSSMISKIGKIVAYGPTNSLLITDYASNVQRILKVIEKLDKQGSQPTVEMIPLKYAQAQDVAEKLNSVFEQEKKTTTRRRGDDVAGGASVQKITPDTRTNSLMVVATREGLGRVLDLIYEFDRPVKISIDRNRIHVKALQNADAKEMAAVLGSLISGAPVASKKKDSKSGDNQSSPKPAGSALDAPMPWDETPANLFPTPSGGVVKSSGGIFEDEVRVVADEATNSIIVTANPNDYAALEQIINQLDARRKQVFVETLIMEVNIERALEVGVSAHGVGNPSNETYAFGGSQLGPGSTDTSKLAGLGGLILGGGSKATFNLGKLSFPMQGMLFHALQENKVFNVLSAPNILTMDNKKAEILIGKDIPIKVQDTVVAGQASTSYKREKVGLQLSVLPKITEGDAVTLEVEQKIQEVEDAPSGGAKDVTTSERSAKTTVVAQNAQTIVIGGLIQDRQRKISSKVPLFGDIPILGYLFRDSTTKHEKQNLVLFLTPHIIRDPMDLTRISVKKNDERRKFNKKMGVGENKALYDYDLDKGLNMAPPAPKQAEQVKPKKRFDYDAPDQTEATPASDVEETVSRRRSAPRNDDGFAQTEQRARPAAVPSSSSGNPFADVRPPSSSN